MPLTELHDIEYCKIVKVIAYSEFVQITILI